MLVGSFLPFGLQKDYLVFPGGREIPSVLLNVLGFVLGLESEGLLNTLQNLVLPLTSDLLIKYSFIILIFLSKLICFTHFARSI